LVEVERHMRATLGEHAGARGAALQLANPIACSFTRSALLNPSPHLCNAGANLPEIKVAFDSAKDAVFDGRDSKQNDLLSLAEFRQFLGSVKRHFFDMFLDAVGREGDGRMDPREFAKFVKQLEVFGVAADAAAAYTSIDSRRPTRERDSGVLMCGEIFAWARGDVEKDFDRAAVPDAARTVSLGHTLSLGADGSVRPAKEAKDATSDLDLRGLVSRLPCSKENPEHATARRKLFDAFDASGNGLLSLMEADAGVEALVRAHGVRLSKGAHSHSHFTLPLPHLTLTLTLTHFTLTHFTLTHFTGAPLQGRPLPGRQARPLGGQRRQLRKAPRGHPTR